MNSAKKIIEYHISKTGQCPFSTAPPPPPSPAVVTDAASAEPPQVYRVVLDRPFVYMIVDTHANLPLFLGTVTQMNG